MNKPVVTNYVFGGRARKSLAIMPKLEAGGVMKRPIRPRPRMAQGGQMLQEGGMAQGPSHEQGGIAAVQQDTGEQVAEIEGGERVFSQEDTAALEQAAMQIVQLSESGDTQKANDMAMRLGYAVVNMIAAQEQNQASQEQQMAQGQEQMMAEEAEAMNQFGTEI